MQSQQAGPNAGHAKSVRRRRGRQALLDALRRRPSSHVCPYEQVTAANTPGRKCIRSHPTRRSKEYGWPRGFESCQDAEVTLAGALADYYHYHYHYHKNNQQVHSAARH